MWIEKDQELQNQNKTNNTNNNVGSGAGTAASGSNTPQGNPSTITPTTSNQPTQNFATIQDYLGANKPQSEDLGQKVVGALSDTQNQEKGSIDQAAQGAKSAVDANNINYDSGLIDKTVNSPDSVANNSNDLNSFLKQWNASYAGPESFEASDQYGTAAKSANDAAQKAAQLGTTGGREQLLQDQFNVYGQGNKGLDQNLLESSSYFPQVQDQAKQFGSIQDYLSGQGTNINNGIAQAKQTDTDTQNRTRTNFNSGVDAAGNALHSAQQQAQSTAASVPSSPVNNLLALLPPNPTDSDLAQYGFTRGQYNAILGTAPQQSNNSNASNSAYASDPNYANALQKYLTLQNLQKQAQASQF